MAGTQARTQVSVSERAQRLGLRMLRRVGGLPLMQRSEARTRVERILYHGARQGFRAELVARRAFARRSGPATPSRAALARPGREFDLTPTEDQQMLQAAARELADEVIRPAAAQADADRAVPEKVRTAAWSMGTGLVGVPTALDGIAEERSAVTMALVIEELARGDMGIAVSLLAPAAVAAALASYGSADQQATYLPAFTGSDSSVAAALALMEPQPLYDPLKPCTSARTERDHLVIDGVKALVPAADVADLFVISADLEGAPRLVIVEPGTAGLSAEDDPAMGLRAAATRRLVLEGVRVPRSGLLGTADDLVDAVRRSRLAWAAAAVGTAQAVLDQVVPYVKQRTAFGEPIGHRQAVAFTVADIAIELAGLRLLVWKAASRLDRGEDASAEIAQARQLAATYGTQIGSDGVQLLGGHGFVKEFDNERWFRDLRAAGVLEGTLLL